MSGNRALLPASTSGCSQQTRVSKCLPESGGHNSLLDAFPPRGQFPQRFFRRCEGTLSASSPHRRQPLPPCPGPTSSGPHRRDSNPAQTPRVRQSEHPAPLRAEHTLKSPALPTPWQQNWKSIPIAEPCHVPCSVAGVGTLRKHRGHLLKAGKQTRARMPASFEEEEAPHCSSKAPLHFASSPRERSTLLVLASVGLSGYQRGDGAAILLPKEKILNEKKSLEGAEEIPTSRDRAMTPGSDTQLVSPLAFLLDLIHCSFTAVIISGKCKAGHRSPLEAANCCWNEATRAVIERSSQSHSPAPAETPWGKVPHHRCSPGLVSHPPN